MKRKILVAVAHPDDEILGCGATISRLVKEGHEAFSLILGEGITARDRKRNREKRANEIKYLRKQTVKANKIIGIKKVFVYDFPDNRFDTVSLLDIVKTIEEVKTIIKPDIIFTHYEKDLNIDHQITYKSIITATRPQPAETVKEIYSFEILSSTEWGYPTSFSPNVFFEVSKTLMNKIKAMKTYRSEIRDFPHPRSAKGIELNARYWGMKTGRGYSEAFQCVRVVK